MILLIDNFDSFVYNLARYFEELGEEAVVVRNDQIGIRKIEDLSPLGIVISPGPCDPRRAGISLDVVRGLGGRVPILGVCLGHQVIGEACGARVVRGQPLHGRASAIRHDGRGLFRDIPDPFTAARYHSLVVTRERFPDTLAISAQTEDGTIMGIRHRVDPTTGVQFHPESVLTEHGHRILENFLALARAFVAGQAGVGAAS